ncbi:ATP-binding protein [Clostridium cylindrosporum]|uniref:histidine kinase n=1 Tax=Clostridium cylindrosporum DSM 605 TaxID=1121307 RepID=A0A0J8D9H4_CLOCY|nr:ATP-binding protein [Clostridium cylindrosporum]KMT20948.1 Two-component sensor histidine kinase [Clostridium cylindrosporum DSM 605]
MKIKTWMAIFYIIIIIIPILTAFSLYAMVKKESEIEEHRVSINNVKRFEKYEDILNNPKLYKEGSKINIKIDESDKKDILIELYSNNGVLIYSSKNKLTLGQRISNNALYKGLYYMRRSDKKNTIKKPVFVGEEVVGIYKITLRSSYALEYTRKTFNMAILAFSAVTLLIIGIISKIINNKIIDPIKDLTFAMREFGEGKDINIRCSSKDEIGMLVNGFNKMKAELLEKNKLIQKEQNAREYMVAAISHDLKTPLTSIRVYTELLSGDTSARSRNKYTEVILDRCDYMKGMIDDLLMYTVLTSSYSKKFVKVEGEEFFDMLFDGYDNMCTLKGINFNSYIGCSGEYRVNVNEMIRVIDNLVSNAINNTEAGKNIWVGAFSKHYSLKDWIDWEFREEINELKQNGVVIVVKNEGEYIGSEEARNIFKPFYKYDQSRQSSGGTGLGLSIVKLIIEQHGGIIRLFSKKGIGNLFVCFLESVKE